MRKIREEPNPLKTVAYYTDLRSRLAEHNRGKCRYTAQHRPWKLKLYVASETRELACGFERYLKSGSGHAFAKRHFWSPPSLTS